MSEHTNYDPTFGNGFDPLKTFRITSRKPKRISAPMMRSEAYDELTAIAQEFIRFAEVEMYQDRADGWIRRPGSLSWVQYLIRVPWIGEDRVDHDIVNSLVTLSLEGIDQEFRIRLVGLIESNRVTWSMRDHDTMELSFA